MRAQEEIQQKINEIGALLDGDVKGSTREVIDAVLDVLENDLDYDEIELKYYDDNATYRELSALSARGWMELENEEIEIW